MGEQFEEWWVVACLQFSLDDADSIRVHFERCWEAAWEAGRKEASIFKEFYK